MSENLARIKAVRAGNRAVITKLTREADYILHQSEVNTGRLQTISTLLDDKLATIKVLDSQVVNLCEVTDIADEIEAADDILSCVLDAQRNIQDGINRLTVQLSTPETIAMDTTETLPNEPSTNDNNTVEHLGLNDNNEASSTAVHQENETVTTEPATPPAQLSALAGVTQLRPKLPKLVLSKFKGNIANWTGFWDSYQVAVHDNPLLSPIDKFNYLNSLLEGAAARAIQGLSLTSANYEHAIVLLKERFGKPQRVITSHMDELLKIPSCNKDNPSSLRYVYDKISIHVRGLESLGVAADQYGSLLIPIIMDKLPSEIKLQVARKASGEVWEINELLKTIQAEIEAREASDVNKVHNASSSSGKTQRPAGTTNALFSNDGLVCLLPRGALLRILPNGRERERPKGRFEKVGAMFYLFEPKPYV
jgi:hypothetical protein